MNSITIDIELNKDNDDIILNFSNFDRDDIKIDTSTDIDLSEYVQQLTFFIQNNKEIVLKKFEAKDPKLQLIQQTIENITNSFNEIINKESSFSD
jgi:hypothetical protein